MPYLGWLRRRGMRLILEDINTGSALELISAHELTKYVDKPVMVVGLITGPHQVKVMSWKVLEE